LDNKVNLSKIAKDMGLSVSTVSRALSGNGRVSVETRQRVNDYIKDKQLALYTRNREYTDIKTNMIAVTVPLEEDFFYMPYFQTILSSVYDFFSVRGYQVIPIKTGENNVLNLQRAIEQHMMDGVIISRQVEKRDEIEMLKKNHVPFVVIGSVESSNVLQIEPDMEKASYDLTCMLIHKGYHKIAIFGANQVHPINHKRFNGIKNAFISNYKVLQRELVFWNMEKDNVAESVVEKVLKDNVDCILCLDDNICLKILYILQRLNIKIPQDIRIASLHSNMLLDKWSPSITCINYNTYLLGSEAGRILYEHLTGETRRINIRLEYRIEVKESTN